jgi:hypothetical protein
MALPDDISMPCAARAMSHPECAATAIPIRLCAMAYILASDWRVP